MKKSNIWKAWTAAAALTALTTVGGIMAYFTDTDEEINKFTVGKIEIDLKEPEWEKKPDTDKDNVPDEAEDMVPAKRLTKDPMVENTGVNDAYIFMTVEVPCRKLITVNSDGTRNPEAMTQLYSYQPNVYWKCLGSCEVKDDTGKQTGKKYLYAYAEESGMCRVVKPKETTKPLFESVLFVNAMEGQGLEETAFEMPIHAYGIQTTDLNEGTKDAAQIWQIITNQKELSEKYQ